MRTEDPRAWRVALALALALPEPPDWAEVACLYASAMVEDNAECDCVRLHVRACPVYRAAGIAAWLRLTPEQMVEAYLADCARRGVEPGPLPSLEYGDVLGPCAPDGEVHWSVDTDDVFIVVGAVMVDMNITGKRAGRVSVTVDRARATVVDLAKATALATAVAKAL